MPKYNHKCCYCGKEYYACASCIGIYSYKNVCCSVECFRKAFTEQKTVAQPTIIDKGETEMQGILLNGTPIDIIGFDLENGKFDCADALTRTNFDFKNFIISYEELKAISLKV